MLLALSTLLSAALPQATLPAPSRPAAPAPRSERTVVLTDIAADDPFAVVVDAVLATTGSRAPLRFRDRPQELLPELRQAPPDHALVVLRPERLDVNLVTDLLTALAAIDDDPFVDVAFGVITGRTPAAALQFFARTQAVRKKPALVRSRLLDLLGPNGRDDASFVTVPGTMMLPALDGLRGTGVMHGQRGLTDGKLRQLGGFGLVHLGGHGVPERIEDGLTAAQCRRLDWQHALVWSGACWTGVTERSFDFRSGTITEVRSADPFCLAVLDAGVAAYFAATHPDHGMPVYQEMEHLFTTGAPLGEVSKHSYDALVLARGGQPLQLPRWRPGAGSPYTGARGEMEWIGTASRVLFGDPRCQPLPAQLEPPWAVTLRSAGKDLEVVARMQERGLRSSFTDTFAGDLCAPDSPFNDRQLLRVPLPHPVQVAAATVTRARGGGKDLKSRVVGHAVECWRGQWFLWLQADFATTAFQTSDLRSRDTEVAWQIRLRDP